AARKLAGPAAARRAGRALTPVDRLPPLLLESGRLEAARHADIALDHGAPRDRDRMTDQAAAHASGARDLDASARDDVPVHLAGYDDVGRLDRAGPAGAGRECHRAVDVAVPVDAAAENVRPRSGNVADELRGRRDESGRAARAVADAALECRHGRTSRVIRRRR